jgi:hypothetical protein
MVESRDLQAFYESILRAGLHQSAVVARIDDDWIELKAPTRPNVHIATADVWSVLRCNAHMPDPVRLVVAPESRVLWLQADLLFHPADADSEARLMSLCQTMREEVFAPRWSSGVPHPAALAVRSPAGRDHHHVAALCEESGWPCTTKPSDEVVINVDTGSASFPAHLELAVDGAVSITVDLFSPASAPSVSFVAASILALEASAVVRSVKALTRLREGAESVALTVRCEPSSTESLIRALSSLTVACQLVGREVQAMKEEGVARDFLSWRGWETLAPPPIAEEVVNDQCVMPTDAVREPSLG